MSRKKNQPFDWFSEADWSRLLYQSYARMLLNDQSLLGVDLRGVDKTALTHLELNPVTLGRHVCRLVRLKEKLEQVEGLSSTTTPSVLAKNLRTSVRKVVSSLGVIKDQVGSFEAPNDVAPPQGEIASRSQNSGELTQPATDILDQEISFLGFRDYLTADIIRRTGVKHIRPLLLLTEDDFKECMQGIMSDESFESIKAVLAKHGLKFSEE